MANAGYELLYGLLLFMVGGGNINQLLL